jgi:hypothetical protein
LTEDRNACTGLYDETNQPWRSPAGVTEDRNYSSPTLISTGVPWRSPSGVIEDRNAIRVAEHQATAVLAVALRVAVAL